MLRIGLAGVGAASHELAAIRRHPGISLTAAADSNPHLLRQFEREHGVQGFSKVEAMCASDLVDAVFIGTPTHFHVEHALASLQHGRHVALAKPMATSLEDADRLIAAAEKRGVHLVVGHTQAFEAPARAMRAIIRGGELGALRMINTWYYTDWIYRGRHPEELDTRLGGGAVYRQGAHQFDILRLLGGGLVKSVRAMTGTWDPSRPAEGAYAAFLDFQDGAVATAVFNGYDHFHSAELGFGIGESGRTIGERRYGSARAALRDAVSKRNELALKRSRRTGRSDGGRLSERHQPFYGLTVVSCERGDIRQSPEGLLIYGEDERREVPLPADRGGRDVLLDELYQAAAHGRRPLYDARWAKATLEVCLAVLTSARERREVELRHQVPLHEREPDEWEFSGAHALTPQGGMNGHG